jgi:hypothetical protein
MVNCVRQYVYVYAKVAAGHIPNLNPLAFSYQDFIWAIAAVATRQNNVPSMFSPGVTVLALIPAWDMSNHAEGQVGGVYFLTRNTNTHTSSVVIIIIIILCV